MMESLHLRRIPLKGADNVRDLGGYLTLSNRQTKFNCFIRSSSTHRLSATDISYLRNYGVKSVIDFRSAEEIRECPSVLSFYEDFSYYHIPTFGPNESHPSFSPSLSMESKYIEMVEDRKEWIHSVFTCMAGCSAGTLFNCTTGKDRTGVISALLLGCVDVAFEDIIADYCVSQIYLRREYEDIISIYNAEHSSQTASLKSGFFSTKPEIMESFLSHIQSKYQGIRPFLLKCGISDIELKSIAAKFIDK